MKAFHSDQAIKDKYLTRVEAHRKADRLIRGVGWENGRGCAVGCTLENYNHKSYETELGIPKILARLEDQLFENLPIDVAMLWPERFLAAIKPGADLEMVWPKFAVWMLSDENHGTSRLCDEHGKAATATVVKLFEQKISGMEPTRKQWLDARDVAWSARRAAAAYAAAAYAAAADAAAYAYAAADAADAAAYAYAAADAAARQKTRDAARRDHYCRMADKLIELLEKAE